MNNNNNSEEIRNSNQNYVDPRTINAEVIGELRKDKIGRPMLVIQMFVIFAIVMIGLPIVNNMMADESSFLYKMFNGNQTVVTNPEQPVNKNEFSNGGVAQPLSKDTNMKFENIVMKNFSLKGNTISCDIYSYNGVINLDKESMFLEVYSSSSNNLISVVKLTGTYDNQVQNVVLTAKDLSFNANYAYEGKMVEYKDSNYPAYTVSSDESGLGSMVCTLDNRTLEYKFKNNYLIGIKDEYKVVLSEQKDNTSYLNLKKTYDEKATSFGVNATVEEDFDGFVFNMDINLETNKIPTNVIDYNYFALDTEAKVIRFTLMGKGFDCK